MRKVRWRCWSPDSRPELHHPCWALLETKLTPGPLHIFLCLFWPRKCRTEEGQHLSKWQSLSPLLSFLSLQPLQTFSFQMDVSWHCLQIPFLCPSCAQAQLRSCYFLDAVLHELSFPLITVTHCGAVWRKQIPLRYPSKWSSLWASFNVINQNYPFLFVFTIWPGSTKENYICIYLNITLISLIQT